MISGPENFITVSVDDIYDLGLTLPDVRSPGTISTVQYSTVQLYSAPLPATPLSLGWSPESKLAPPATLWPSWSPNWVKFLRSTALVRSFMSD